MRQQERALAFGSGRPELQEGRCHWVGTRHSGTKPQWKFYSKGCDDSLSLVSFVIHVHVQYPKPTRFTVQITPDKHMDFAGGLEFVNHSCNPNTRIDMAENEAKVSFVAIKPITEGEHLTFDYSTSEWDMDEKFDCRCGAPKCRGHVGGAKYLSDDEVNARLPYFTPSVLRQLLDRKLTN